MQKDGKMEEKKQYDNTNNVAAWRNEDGSLFLAGNLFGNDFKMKLFINEFKKDNARAPDFKGKLKVKEVPVTSQEEYDL